MEITLQLFGAFRPFGEKLNFLLPENAIVSDIRKKLADTLAEIDKSFLTKGLIESSRFATETEILSEATSLKNGMVIAIIPPVAGG